MVIDPDASGRIEETQATEKSPEISRRWGPYKLLHRLGEGGMGEVWLAQQLQPIQRQVAIKVVKAGMDSARVVARFEAERQALALMDHPAIAKVFDAGTTPEGRPFFVMEFVRGEAITTYCDRMRLTVRERLELFIQLCEGIQHAHQKGIIHRDLKPSNVLIATVDDRPVPRVIDFGVSKAVAQPLMDHSLFTEFGTLIGTPEYMSPEQADLTSVDVDTRSDVYSLGLLLYELLVGSLPFDRDALRREGFDAIRRTIRDVDVPRPSTQVTQRRPDTGNVAERRRTQPTKLAGLLRGDLDWITVKALEKDRARRYATANALAMDIRRHLADEPVLAGPPGASYRIKKFVHRHQFSVAAATILLALLASFAVAMTVQAKRIAQERDRANQEAATAKQISDFLVGLFKVSDPSEARGNRLTAREILDKGSRELDAGLRDKPQVHARLQATIASVYSTLGMYTNAKPMLESAFQTERALLGADHSETLATQHQLANLLWYQSLFDQAEPLYIDLVERQTRLSGPDHIDTLKAKFDLASTYLGLQRFDDYERLGKETLANQRRVLGPEHPDTLSSLNNLQAFYYRRQRYVEAEDTAREVFEIRRRVLPTDHPELIRSIHNLAATRAALGRDADAEALFVEAIDKERRVLGPDHPQTCRSLLALGRLYAKQQRYKEAEMSLLAAYDGFVVRLGRGHADTTTTVDQLAALYDATGQPTIAAQWRAKLSVQ